MGEVGDGHPDVAVPEVDADRIARRGRQRKLVGWPPALAERLRRRLLEDQASDPQLGDQRRDRRPGKAGEPGEVGLRHAALLAQDVDDQRSITLPKGRRDATELYPQLLPAQ